MSEEQRQLAERLAAYAAAQQMDITLRQAEALAWARAYQGQGLLEQMAQRLVVREMSTEPTIPHVEE